MAVESPRCPHDEKNESALRGLPQWFAVWEPPTAEASQLELFRSVTNQSRTGAGGGGREEDEDKTSEDSGTHPASLANEHTNCHLQKKKTTTGKPFCSQWRINITLAASHTPKCSIHHGMNEELHTWNFLGYRSFLHLHCYLLREQYPVFLLSVKHQ